MRRGEVIFALLFSIGLVVAGFAVPAAAGDQLGKKEYLKQGNAICEDATEELAAPTEELFADLEPGEQPSPEAQTAYVATITPVARQSLDDLAALDGPPKLERKVDKVIDEYTAIVDAVEADPSVYFDADKDPFVKPNRAFVRLGLKDCG